MLDDNWAALCIAILKPATVEFALGLIKNPELKRLKLTDDDVKDILKMKNEGMSYQEIGDIYCRNLHSIFTTIKNAEKKFGGNINGSKN